MSVFRISVILSIGVFLIFFQNCGAPMTSKTVAEGNEFLSESARATPTPTPIPSGPIGGRWMLGSWMCGSKDIFNQAQSPMGVRNVGLEVNGSTAKQSVLFFGSCTQVQSSTYSYPAPGQIAVLIGATTCEGACTVGVCKPLSAPIPARTYGYVYTVSGSTLTMSRILTNAETLDSTSPYKMAGCTAGQSEVLVFNKFAN